MAAFRNYHTLAGFVLTQLGRIPNVSEHFEWEGYRFGVMDMDRNRIDRLLVSRIASVKPPVSDNEQSDTEGPAKRTFTALFSRGRKKQTRERHRLMRVCFFLKTGIIAGFSRCRGL